MLQTIGDLPAANLRFGDTIPRRGIVNTTTNAGAEIVATFTNGNQACFPATARIEIFRVI